LLSTETICGPVGSALLMGAGRAPERQVPREGESEELSERHLMLGESNASPSPTVRMAAMCWRAEHVPEESARSGTQRVVHILVESERGEDQDARLGIVLLGEDPAGGVDAVGFGNAGCPSARCLGLALGPAGSLSSSTCVRAVRVKRTRQAPRGTAIAGRLRLCDPMLTCRAVGCGSLFVSGAVLGGVIGRDGAQHRGSVGGWARG
jgi:hypothetical protein